MKRKPIGSGQRPLPPKPSNPMAVALADGLFKLRVIRPSKGRGSPRRKAKHSANTLLPSVSPGVRG